MRRIRINSFHTVLVVLRSLSYIVRGPTTASYDFLQIHLRQRAILRLPSRFIFRLTPLRAFHSFKLPSTTMVNTGLKYVDLIRQRTSKWANLSPETQDIRVGSYGLFSAQTGRFEVEGNVYDPEFQKLLDATDGKIKLSDHLPVLDDEEKDFAVGSMGVRPKEFSLASNCRGHRQSKV
ncbi:uncharacterized protein HD556DRAFT_850034 [Suillus plorans]|uniref:Uncharacterized protein n=1 Tax=Suillus plorans TaxID=116603 RepID=A0A9P7AG76_9AGAM|nr:uncharacterized protein HD556DRAFT_850034 [Suillus plorans]KAG1788686.1 hypothetical protein HD556DRAFT_850034 [Suillus plorans]